MILSDLFMQKNGFVQITFAVILILGSTNIWASASSSAKNVAEITQENFDYKMAVKLSQGAIGKTLGNYSLIDKDGKPLMINELQGKPLIISMIYTSCYHTCPMTTRNLLHATEVARSAFGQDSFSIATIGFDSQIDTPERMKNFAVEQGIEHINNWYFLSIDEKTRGQLMTDLGFIYYPSPRGFDHVVQATVIDEKSVIYRQVYGETFDTPLLVEPLKELILGEKKEQAFFDGLINKVRFFCTTYDPGTDNYRFDYSIFVGMIIGGIIILLGFIFLIREFRRKNISTSQT